VHVRGRVLEHSGQALAEERLPLGMLHPQWPVVRGEEDRDRARGDAGVLAREQVPLDRLRELLALLHPLPFHPPSLAPPLHLLAAVSRPADLAGADGVETEAADDAGARAGDGPDAAAVLVHAGAALAGRAPRPRLGPQEDAADRAAFDHRLHRAGETAVDD